MVCIAISIRYGHTFLDFLVKNYFTSCIISGSVHDKITGHNHMSSEPFFSTKIL